MGLCVYLVCLDDLVVVVLILGSCGGIVLEIAVCGCGLGDYVW